MSEPEETQERRQGFLDSLGRLFRAKEKSAEAPSSEEPEAIRRLETLDSAIRALEERIAQQREAASAAGGAGARRLTADELAAERERRMQAVHRAMREDIEKMHSRLGTGLSAADLDAVRSSLEEIGAVAAAGRGSHELLPCARRAILEKLWAEAGELAVARTVSLVRSHGIEWPDPSRPPASATQDEIERARRRRLADLRKAFLGDGFERTAETLQGIVKGWGSDYPDRGSPLWEGCVLEGVAAGVRGDLMTRFADVLRRDRDALLADFDAAVGEETAALQRALAAGVHSLDQANLAVQSALRVVEDALPAIAWERLRSQLPAARGESG